MMEMVISKIVDSLKGAEVIVDVHASDTFVKEIPQARISEEFEDMMVPYARQLDVDLIWINAATAVHESSLAYSMCKLGVPALILEMGLGNRINREYGEQVVEGILHLMHKLFLWEGSDYPVKEPRIIRNEDICFIRASESGFFMPLIENDTHVTKGTLLGEMINPMLGEKIYEVRAECAGRLFTLREHPLAYEGALIGRILKDEKEKTS